MTSIERTLAAGAGLALALAAPLSAQQVGAGAAGAPGYQGMNAAQIRAEYNARVVDHVNGVMARWDAAWTADKLDELLDIYTEDAVLILPGAEPLRGREAVREHLRERLPRMGRAEAFMLDLAASGEMAVVYGNYTLSERGAERAGPLVTVYRGAGPTWKIRAQVFAEPAGDGPGR